MADRQRAQDLNEAANRFAETLADSYRLVYEQAAESAERQQQRAREFSKLVSSSLEEQTEAGRANAQQLSEQAAKQRVGRPDRGAEGTSDTIPRAALVYTGESSAALLLALFTGVRER